MNSLLAHATATLPCSTIASSTVASSTLASSTLASSTLAWTPFLQPAPGVQHWWWLLVLPMALGVAMSYKAIRTADLRDYRRAVITMTLQICAAMAGIAVGLYVLVLLLLPLLPAE